MDSTISATPSVHRIQVERHTLHRRVIAMEYKMGRLMRRPHDTKAARRAASGTTPQPPADPIVAAHDPGEAHARLQRLREELDENTRLFDLLDSDDAPIRTLQAALDNAMAEIASTQAALCRIDLTPHERVAIAVAIHETGAYPHKDEGGVPLQAIAVGQTAEKIGLTPRTFGTALIRGADVGLINRTEQVCSKTEQGDVRYKMIVRLGPPIAFQVPRIARRIARKAPVAAVAAGDTAPQPPHAPTMPIEQPQHNPSYAPPTCATCNAHMVAMEWCCPLCAAGSDNPPESYVVKQHIGESIDMCAVEQQMVLFGPAVGANAGDWAEYVTATPPVPDSNLSEAAAIARVCAECGLTLRLSETVPYKILVSPSQIIARYPDVADMIRNWREQLISYLYNRDEAGRYSWVAP